MKKKIIGLTTLLLTLTLASCSISPKNNKEISDITTGSNDITEDPITSTPNIDSTTPITSSTPISTPVTNTDTPTVISTGDDSSTIISDIEDNNDNEDDLDDNNDGTDYASDDNTDISEFSIITSDGSYTQSSGLYTITSAGTYTLTGKLRNGQFYINTTEDSEVVLELNGVEMTSENAAIIYAYCASKVTIKAVKNTVNTITDNRNPNETYLDETGSAAIYALCDLKFGATGTLNVYGNYNNGIHTKDDLHIQKLTLNVTAYNNALKGNDEVEIESGNLNIISTGGDGIKTENSDISSKGNQKGSVNIIGGNINIYAACDGIDSAYNVNVEETEEVPTTLNIFTDSYSEYSGEVKQENNILFVRIPKSAYSTNYKYALYFYNNESGEFKELSLSTNSGNYYYLSCQIPTGYESIQLYRFSSSQELSTTSYQAASSGMNINTSMNCLVVKSISSSTITTDWTNYNTTSSNSYSTKGIKAQNDVIIDSGTIQIKSKDDGIHANYGITLENNETSTGNVTINGGNIEITTGDDGIKADYILTINGGTINVLSAYEGLEGANIEINGGSSYVKASDDGVNSGSTNYLSSLVKVTGGYLDVFVGSGDTDGIDSNGNYTQTGGFVITKCGATGGGCAALDIDGTATITGGTIIAAGPMEVLPSSSSINYVRFGNVSQMGGNPFNQQSSSSSSVSFSAGNYTVKDSSNNELINFTLPQTYTAMWIASDLFGLNNQYNLSNSSTTYSWTQSSQATVY